jgi:hypothetical protein
MDKFFFRYRLKFVSKGEENLRQIQIGSWL